MKKISGWFAATGSTVGLLIFSGCQLGDRHQPEWLGQHSPANAQTALVIADVPANKSPDFSSGLLMGDIKTHPVEKAGEAIEAGIDGVVPLGVLASSSVASPRAVWKSGASNRSDRATSSLKTVAYNQEDSGSSGAVSTLPYDEPSDEFKITGDGLVVAENIAQYDSAQGITGLPIDFSSVLRLAGADNWNVKIAQQKICEAVAHHQAARVAWLPSLNIGVGYNHHEGEIQSTEGDVVTVSRGSLFVGGGSKIGNNPIAGGSGGPSRLAVDLSLADAIFQPLVTRQLVNAERYRESRVFNNVMLQSSIAYFELVRSQSKLAVAQENQRESEQVYKLMADFVDAGKGSAADQQRMQGIVNERQRASAMAKAKMGVASSRLANVLQLDRDKLDPSQGLYAMEPEVVPIHLVQTEMGLSALVDQALTDRQEIQEANWRSQSAKTQLEVEQWRPYLPNLSAGTSNGFFGGGTGGDLPKMDSRSDIDLQMTWEVRNMGAGAAAARAARRSQFQQAVFRSGRMKDQIANEVAEAYHSVELYADSMVILQDSIAQAENALNLNVEAIRGLEGMPLEAVQSLNALSAARVDYLDAVIEYNLAQLRLLRAIGQPIMQSES